MKIGLMGFEFKSANKGCEALVYSFLSIIREKLEDKSIVYNFSGTDLGNIPLYFKKIKFKNVPPRLKSLKFEYLRAIRKCDIIFDVTMGDSFSDIYSKKYYDSLLRHKYIAELLCKKYILLPQTYGPFEHEDSSNKAKKILKKAYKIYCRDEISLKLLKNKFDIKNAILVSDIAFVLPYDKNMYQFSKKIKIGINVSGLLYKGGFHTKNQFNLSINYPLFVDNVIKTFSKIYEVHLIPHVIDLQEKAYDDDYKICKMLKQKYSDTVLAPIFEDPIQAKSYISNMDFFIGSRMHSTIASFSSGVITLPVSYSRKFEGLFGSLNYPFVINAKKETTKSALKLIMKYLNNAEKLVKTQQESLLIIAKKNKEFKESIIKTMKEI